jgi:hypothetical protein
MNTLTLFGSKAIKHHYPDFPREGKDTDYLYWGVDKPKSTREVEYFSAPFLEPQGEIIDMDVLYTIKLSHLIRDIHFTKHLKDLMFLKSKGHKRIEKILQDALAFWNEYHGVRSIPDFDKENEEFFKDKVVREYNHDTLHNMVKYYDVPMFEKIKSDKTRAVVDKDMFDMLSEVDKRRVVLEEAYVIALERYVLKSGCPPKIAFHAAMRALITRLFPEWLALYAIENYDVIASEVIDFQKFVRGT